MPPKVPDAISLEKCVFGVHEGPKVVENKESRKVPPTISQEIQYFLPLGCSLIAFARSSPDVTLTLALCSPNVALTLALCQCALIIMLIPKCVNINVSMCSNHYVDTKMSISICHYQYVDINVSISMCQYEYVNIVLSISYS